MQQTKKMKIEMNYITDSGMDVDILITKYNSVTL